MTVNSADCSILIPTGLIDGDDELIQYKLTGFIGIGNQFDMESPTNLGGPRATNYRIGTAGNIPVISKVLTVVVGAGIYHGGLEEPFEKHCWRRHRGPIVI